MATRCSVLAWRIPWTEEPGGLWSVGWPGSDTTKTNTVTVTVQCCIDDGVNWAPRLTLLDLQTNWIYKGTLGMELVCM